MSNQLLLAITQGIYDDLKPKIPEKQSIYYWTEWTDGPAIEISQNSDRRYTIGNFFIKNSILSCKLLCFTRFLQQEQKISVDINNPMSFDSLCKWLYIESLDGIRYGRTGIQNDSFRLRLSTRYSRNPQPPLYHQKLIQFPED